MPGTCCCVPGCSHRGGHLFPKEQLRRKRWIVAIRRDKWKPTRASVVCPAHFEDGDYFKTTTHGDVSSLRTLRRTAVPSIFFWTKSLSETKLKRKARFEQRQATKVHRPAHDDVETTNQVNGLGDVGAEITISSEVDCFVLKPEEDEQAEVVHTGTQTDPLPSTTNQTFSSIKFKDDPKGMHYFTGLKNYETFLFVLNTLGPAANHLTYYYTEHVDNLSIENQFFLVLIKLRRKETHFLLSRLFEVSEFTVANVFITWINFMYLEWKSVDWWPDKGLTKFFAPSDMKAKFPNTRIIIDGTEIPIKKPKAPLAQQATFSTYKNRNTVKVLVGITPAGLVSYVSPAFGGSTSDRQIVERSNLFSLCDPKDSIMADKGFNVQDLFAPHDVRINMPSFFRKKNRMTCSNVLEDRKISSKRVHVERVIGLAKTYRMLTQAMNHTETKLATEIIFVCFMLCNFRDRIVSVDA